MNRFNLTSYLSHWAALGRLRWDAAAVLFLIVLCVLHVPPQLVSYLPWEDPRSFRKPILFGLSTGLTLGSLLLLMNELRPRRGDHFLRTLLCVTLVIEVLLITLQAWRQVPSHFNHSTGLDITIELMMLCCIMLALIVILALTVRVFQRDAFFRAIPARILAQQTGMVFLAISCVLGIGITILGNYLIFQGGSPETLGKAGVLKFPHGAVLHAIQTLVLWAWLCDVFKSARSVASVAWLAIAHVFFLTYAVRQTLLGRSRWESDDVGWLFLGFTLIAAVLSLLFAIWPRK
jgi:hypothetical protein